MIVLAAAMGLQLATAWRAEPPRIDDGALVERYRRECGGGRGGAACRTLRLRLERSLYDDLRALYAEGGEADRATLRIAAGAEYAPLAAFALRRLAPDLRPSEEPLVLAAVESPYPLVRRTAAPMLLQLRAPRRRRLLQRVYTPHGRSPYDDTDPGMLADEAPTFDRLGVPAYSGARFRYLPSGPERAFFTTSDPPASVVAFYAAGRPVLTVEEAERALARRPPAERGLVDAPAGRAVLKASWRRRVALRAWVAGLAAEEGVEQLRYVLFEADEPLGIRVVAVFHDTILEATAIVVSTPWVTSAVRLRLRAR
jgi:hypothetical protein